ncbi:MAG: hypothetical protein D6768_14255 [Chloroflexi bacterium]|nr:MAG: hypothetical protein D6768_14255 [Chloroflexota bacterium]
MKRNLFIIICFGLFLVACVDRGDDVPPVVTQELADVTETAVPIPTPRPSPTAAPDVAPSVPATFDKFSLWVDGPHLRGANIWQAIVIPELDGLEFKGPGPVGPPFTQEDFNRLAALGANYVSISGPGLFTETPPYELDPGVQENLDNLLAMIEQADMFATISIRTGPGRSEFTLCCAGEPGFDGYFNDTMWEDPAAQDAWVEMWRTIADRYKDNPIVVGYKLMVEPNSSGVFFDIYEPDEFYDQYAGTLYDWNQLYPRIVAAIREVDTETPILIGGNGWSGVAWLNYLEPVDDPRTVYIVHQYEPQEGYTHQEGRKHSYPGEFDLDYDGEDDSFNRAWLDEFLSPIDTFKARYGVPVAVDEFGVNRWSPGAAEFMADQMALFEEKGMNHALWEWSTSWEPFASDVYDMNYLLGPDPDNHLQEVPNELLDVITGFWARNEIRPSTFTAPAQSENTPQDTLSAATWWQPTPGLTWQWQLDQPVDTSYDVAVYDVDLFETETAVIADLHAQGKKVICYLSAGSWEEWRPDADQFPPAVLGNDYDGWPGEKWLDIRQIDQLAPIMRARLDLCRDKGFDAVEPDNIDGYTNDTGFPLTYDDQLAYNIWLAEEAHVRGLAIGLKNDDEQVTDLLPYFDWALTEDCFDQGWCEEMSPFIVAGKPVFAAEYTDTGITADDFCPQAEALGFSAILKHRDLDAWVEVCSDY